VTHLKGEARLKFIREMFARIAPSYDRLNRIMTFGQDMKWRKEAAQMLSLSTDAVVLDLGSGSGDMLLEVLQQYPKSTVIGMDITPEMVQISRNREGLKSALWVIANVQSLPFASSTFDGTISAFLMRNLEDVGPAFEEQYRILRDAGRLVCLETSPPKRNPLHFLVGLYLTKFIPILGGIFARNKDAYAYLASSTVSFLSPEHLVGKLVSTGFAEVRFIQRMFGVIAIHTARKIRSR
jgi:demethylmenaquinone methyltransferase/2-methoxy-6-polyprenyl-1,4-benzoquinol methylase